MYQCAMCLAHGCQERDEARTRPDCPGREAEIQQRAIGLYDNEENRRLAVNAALTEQEGYCRLTRIEEIMHFARRCGYRRIGLAFCVGLAREANMVARIFRHNGFEMVSVACKNGSHPKGCLGLGAEQTLDGTADEVMCNPIGQALLLNEAKTELNLLLGLCVGHDTLCIKHMEAPVTVLAVKDRVTGHSPLAPVYMAEGYYKKKLFPEQS